MPQPEETTQPGPYAAAAAVYWAAGWRGLLPLPPHSKTYPPTGYTGRTGQWPSYADILTWAEDKPDANIALRMPPDVIGIDVDQYTGKNGAATLADLEARYGPLPPTWRSTSRDDTTSSIRFYRVPEGLAWPGEAGADIEIIQTGHRYAVVAPSVHPSGGVYRWINPDGAVVIHDMPTTDDLPDLPDTWVEGLTRGESASDIPKLDLDTPTVSAWLNARPKGDPCPDVRRANDRWLRDLAGHAGSRHAVAARASIRLIRLAAEGHPGAVDSLDPLRVAFLSAVNDGTRQPGEAEAEWTRMVVGAVKIAAAGPIGVGDPCTFGDLYEVNSRSFAATGNTEQHTRPPSGAAPQLGDNFYTARQSLAHIRTAARARLVAPDALLGAVLARVSLLTDYRLCLPALPRKSPLNIIVALCGQSGEGKGASMDVAAELLPSGHAGCECGDMDHVGDHVKVPAGSGEGLVRNFFDTVTEETEGADGKKKREQKLKIDRRHVLISIDEGEVLASLANRQGQTTMQILRQSWSGEELGFSYANKEKNLRIPAYHYRQSIVMGIQPTLAKPLFDDVAGGTPQRFLWFGLSDPAVPDECPPWPGDLGPISFAEIGQPWSDTEMRTAPGVVKEITAARRDRIAGRLLVSPMDSHRNLSRLKVAGLLARLERRTDIDVEDWRLAGMVLDVSDGVREWVRSLISEEAKETARARSHARAEDAATIDEHLHAKAVQRVSRSILRKLGEDWMPGAQLRKALGSRDRQYFAEAIDALTAGGQLESQDSAYRGQSGTEYRRVVDHG